jgi:hypothetical protein
MGPLLFGGKPLAARRAEGKRSCNARGIRCAADGLFIECRLKEPDRSERMHLSVVYGHASGKLN